MGMVVHPVFPTRDERYRGRAVNEVSAILTDQKQRLVEQIAVDFIDDAGGSIIIVDLRSLLALLSRNRNALAIARNRYVSKRSPHPIRRQGEWHFITSHWLDLRSAAFTRRNRPLGFVRRNALQQFRRRLIVRVLRHEFAAGGEVEDGLTELPDLVGARGEGGQRVEREAGVGLEGFRIGRVEAGEARRREPVALRLPPCPRRLQPVAQGHQLIDLSDEAV